MKLSRRKFISSSAAFATILNIEPLSAFNNSDPSSEFHPVSDVKDGWHLKIRRAAQHNLSEHDPLTLDIDEWVNYWKELKLDAIVLTAGGFIALYPTKIPYHYKSQFLGERDLFGDYLKACKKAGIRVIARIETNWIHRDIFKEKPEWFERNHDGSPRPNIGTPWVYRSCLFSDYRHEQIPKIMREIMSAYDVDGFFTNSWPHSGSPRICHSESCKSLSKLSDIDIYERYQNRVFEICQLFNSIVKEKKEDCIYNINISGGISAAQNLKKLGDIAELITTDSQGRNGNTPVWDCAQKGRVAYAVMKGKPVTNVVGTKTGPWRHSTKSEAETNLWLAQTTSSGMVPWYVWLGSELPDRRWREIGRKYFQWLAHNESHFENKQSITNLGVVYSARQNKFYSAPGKIPAGYGETVGDQVGRGNPTDYMQGTYYALLEGRFTFDFVHEADLELESLKKYSSLILPNIALLSDHQVKVLEEYVNSGGSLLATFETGLFDEWGNPRKEFALSNIFDVTLKEDYKGPVGKIFYSNIKHHHDIVKGFGDTDRLPGGEYHIPVNAPGEHILTVVPPYPNGIPEMVYAHDRKEREYGGQDSNLPAIVVRKKKTSRLVYFPIDIDRNIWIESSADLSKLYIQAVQWLLNGSNPVTVKGEGMVEIFAWETTPGFALHILNYNNPNMTKASIRSHYPIGEQHIRMKLPKGVTIKSGKLLRKNVPLKIIQTNDIVEFLISSIDDFEIAALYKV